MRKTGLFLHALVVLTVCACAAPPQPLLTGLEQSHYQRLADSTEIGEFLNALARRSPLAQATTVGVSAQGKPIEALLISEELDQFSRGRTGPDRATVFLIGSQHGSEPSGAEALLLIARDLVEGDLRPLVERMNVIIIPNGNPDGRDRNRRVNGNGVNLSTNYVTLTEPEARAVMDAVYRWKPHVILDVHESAVLKKKSLGKQGYLIDFEAQFEGANNPNVAEEIRAFTYDIFLPYLIDRVSAQGLHAQRYIGEITDVNQLITHGGLSLRNIRNSAGMTGAFSILLENRLDPSTGSYSTPRNIRVRVAKQYLCIAALLAGCFDHGAEMIAIAEQVRRQWREPPGEEAVMLSYGYFASPENTFISLPLRERESDRTVLRPFKYYGSITSDDPLPVPASYVITGIGEELRNVLDSHRIRYETAVAPTTVTVTLQRINGRTRITSETKQSFFRYSIEERTSEYTLREGDLLVPLDQPARRLIPLLLEPTSMSSIFNEPRYAPLVKEGEDFSIYRVR